MIYPAEVRHLEYTFREGHRVRPNVVYCPHTGNFQEIFYSDYEEDEWHAGEVLSPKQAVEAVRGWQFVTIHFEETFYSASKRTKQTQRSD